MGPVQSPVSDKINKQSDIKLNPLEDKINTQVYSMLGSTFLLKKEVSLGRFIFSHFIKTNK